VRDVLAEVRLANSGRAGEQDHAPLASESSVLGGEQFRELGVTAAQRMRAGRNGYRRQSSV
jgi:hypothetical protein